MLNSDMQLHEVYELKISLLTPLHIGSGQVLPGSILSSLSNAESSYGVLDIDEYVLKKTSHISDLEELKLEVDRISKGLRSSEFYLSSGDPILRKIMLRADLPAQFREFIHLDLPHKQIPYIPGSSLKGSWRTSLILTLLKPIPQLYNRFESWSKFDFQKNYSVQLKKLTGKDAHGDVGRLVVLPDILFEKETTTEIRKSICANWANRWIFTKGDGRNLDTYLECLPEGACSVFKWTFHKQLFQLIQDHNGERDQFRKLTKKNHDLFQPKGALFTSINECTQKLLDADLAFLNNKPKTIPEVSAYLEKIKWLKSEISKSNPKAPQYCIMRFGYGSGFPYITGGWQREKLWDNGSREVYHRLKKAIRGPRYDQYSDFPKTRRMLDDGTPLGFVKIEDRS